MVDATSVEMKDRDTAKITKAPLVTFLAFGALLISLWIISTYNFLLFHSLAEIIGVVISFSIAIVILGSVGNIENGYLRVIGTSYLFTGLIEVIHLLAYKGMGVFPGEGSNLATQLWLAFRYLQAFSLIAAILFINRRPKYSSMFTIYAIVTGTLLIAIGFRIFPIGYIDGQGLTPFKIVSEYIIAAIFIVAALILYRSRRRFNSKVYQPLLVACLFAASAEIAFTSYLSVVSFATMLGHLLMLTEFLLIYLAIVRVGIKEPTNLLYRDLESRERRFRELVENSSDMMFRYDLRTAKFDYVGPAAEKLLGYRPEELGATTDLFYRAMGTENEAAIRDILSPAQQDSPRTLMFRRRNGEATWLEISSVQVHDADGEVIAKEGIIRDVTERARMQNELQTANRKLILLGKMTRHDVLNQATSIAGYIELGSMATSPERSKEYLAKAKASLEGIVKQMEFTREYEGLGAISPRWMSIRTTATSGLKETLKGRVTIHCTLGDIDVYADPLLERVFLNLAQNSLKHGKNVSKVGLSCRDAPNGLIITYEDDGIGIPASEKTKIFEWAYQGRKGHGLNLVREVLAITGASIAETGEPGIEARFEITFPPGAYRVNIACPGAEGSTSAGSTASS